MLKKLFYLATRNQEGYYYETYLADASPSKQDSYDRSAERKFGFAYKLFCLRRTIAERSPRKVAEVGVKHGFSTYSILKSLGDGALFSYDLASTTPNGMRTGHLAGAPDGSRWKLRIGDANNLLVQDGPFEFVYQDVPFTDLDKMLPLLWDSIRPGGILFFGSHTINPKFDEFAAGAGGYAQTAERELGFAVPHIGAWAYLVRP